MKKLFLIVCLMALLSCQKNQNEMINNISAVVQDNPNWILAELEFEDLKSKAIQDIYLRLTSSFFIYLMVPVPLPFGSVIYLQLDNGPKIPCVQNEDLTAIFFVISDIASG